MSNTVFVVGGTGAQGIPVVTGLVQDKKYKCRVLTRDVNSPRAKEIEALGNVELVTGTFASEKDLREGLRGCSGFFCNIDGFNSGEKAEIFWTIRAYELAIEEGVKFFVLGNLDYGYKLGGFDPKFHAGHYDAKGRMGEWILGQNKDNQHRMKAALFTTGPYMEMALSRDTPMAPVIENGVLTWRVPLGDGAVPHVALRDCAFYVRWLFDNQERANGLDLQVSIEHVHYEDMARAFEKVTGHPAKFVDTDLDTYWKTGSLSRIAHKPAGYNADITLAETMSMRQNFTGFWNMWKHSGRNKGIIQRDYKLLDEIHPGRIKTVEEYFLREHERAKASGYPGLFEMAKEQRHVLKITEDGRTGKL